MVATTTTTTTCMNPSGGATPAPTPAMATSDVRAACVRATAARPTPAPRCATAGTAGTTGIARVGAPGIGIAILARVTSG